MLLSLTILFFNNIIIIILLLLLLLLFRVSVIFFVFLSLCHFLYAYFIGYKELNSILIIINYSKYYITLHYITLR